MIAEAAIVGMLLYGHDLDAVVAVLDDAREDVLAELVVGAHLLGILCHTDMTFVDEERVDIGLVCLMLEDVRSGRRPYLGGEYLRLLVLHDTCGPGGDTFAAASRPVHHELIEVEMVQCVLLQREFPHAIANAGELIVDMLFPVVERADEEDLRSVGCPFAENPSLFGMVQTEVEISRSKIGEAYELPYPLVRTLCREHADDVP
jgi:hypothetical protein